LPDDVKNKIEKSIKKAVYMCVQGGEKNTDSMNSVMQFLVEGLLQKLVQIAEHFPMMHPLLTKVLLSPLAYSDKTRRVVDDHGHDDYSSPQPHVVDCEACHCSVFQLMLHHYPDMLMEHRDVLHRLLIAMTIPKDSKIVIASNIVKYFMYLVLDPVYNLDATKSPSVLEVFYGYCINEDVSKAMGQLVDITLLTRQMLYIARSSLVMISVENGGQFGLNRYLYFWYYLILHATKLMIRLLSEECIDHTLQLISLVDSFSPKYRVDFQSTGLNITEFHNLMIPSLHFQMVMQSTLKKIVYHLGVLMVQEEEHYFQFMLTVFRKLKTALEEWYAAPKTEAIRHYDFLQWIFLYLFNFYLATESEG
jgi:hypothetical protein